MANPVVGDEVVNGIALQGGKSELIDPINATIGKEYGFGIGVEAFDVADAIVLLDRTGQFMLLDPTLVVFPVIAAPDEADLRPTVHG